MVSRDSKQERLSAHISALVSLDVKEQLAPSYCSGLRMVRGRGFEADRGKQPAITSAADVSNTLGRNRS
jgi:hypothetical protein